MLLFPLPNIPLLVCRLLSLPPPAFFPPWADLDSRPNSTSFLHPTAAIHLSILPFPLFFLLCRGSMKIPRWKGWPWRSSPMIMLGRPFRPSTFRYGGLVPHHSPSDPGMLLTSRAGSPAMRTLWLGKWLQWKPGPNRSEKKLRDKLRAQFSHCSWKEAWGRKPVGAGHP